MRIRYWLVIACVAPVSGITAQDAPPRFAAAVDSVMRAEMARAGTPGGQVAVAVGGPVVYTKAYGVSDVTSGRLVNEKTLFQFGSLAKMTTAALVTRLAVEGKLDLNAPISRYVPELAGRRVGTVTLHQLLTHTAGWANVSAPNSHVDDDRLVEIARAQSDSIMFTEPGAIYSYTNRGYAMLGYIAEAVSHRPFAVLRDSVVFRGLGMPLTTSQPFVAMTYDFALGHAGPAGTAGAIVRPMPDNGAERAAGFIWSNAAEFARLAIALMDAGMIDGKRVLDSAAVRMMTTGHVTVPSGNTATERSGYGMNVDVIDGRRVWIANGGVTGYQASTLMWPDQKVAVVVTSNRQNPSMTIPAVWAVGKVVGDFQPRRTIVYEPERDPTPAERAQLIGAYGVSPLGNAFTIVDADGKLELLMLRFRYPVRLTNSGDRIVIKRPATDDLVYVLVRDAQGNLRYMHSGGRAFLKR
jgi:CubicO group peptidase (beta-lactamase class C family)